MDSKDSEELLFPEPTLEDADGNGEFLRHLIKARELLQKFYELRKKSDWNVEYDSDGVTLWSRPHEESSVNYCRRYMEVNANMIEVIKIMKDSEENKSADEKITEYEYCYDYNPSSHILKIKLKGNLLVSDRVIIIFDILQELSNGSFVRVTFSINTDKVEVESGCVVANNTMYCLAKLLVLINFV